MIIYGVKQRRKKENENKLNFKTCSEQWNVYNSTKTFNKRLDHDLKEVVHSTYLNSVLRLQFPRSNYFRTCQ